MRRRGNTNDALTLSSVYGNTILSSNHIACSKESEDVFYTAGACTVRYSPSQNRQINFYSATKAISCLCVSNDGRYLAMGERGYAPSILIYDLMKSGQQVVTLTGKHNYGIGCLKFSPNNKYLVSCGFKPDKQLIFWDWYEEKALSIQKLINKVYCLDFCTPNTQNIDSDLYFITAGDRHLKWWYITEVLDGEAVGLEGKPASILEEHRLSRFVDFTTGSAYPPYQEKVFLITSQGVLSRFDEERNMEVSMNIEDFHPNNQQTTALTTAGSTSNSSNTTSSTNNDSSSNATAHAYCLVLFHPSAHSRGILFVGCSAGRVKGFDPTTLEYLMTMTPQYHLASLYSNQLDRQPPAVYPACLALVAVPPASTAVSSIISSPSRNNSSSISSRSDSSSSSSLLPRLYAVYADRSMLLYDIQDIHASPSVVLASQAFHYACIWDVKFLLCSNINNHNTANKQQQVKEEENISLDYAVVTCSNDNTIKLWDIHHPSPSSTSATAADKSSSTKSVLTSISLTTSTAATAGQPADAEQLAADNNNDLSVIASTATGISMHPLMKPSATPGKAAADQPVAMGTLAMYEQLAYGLPDSELPDRYTGNTSHPRALAILHLNAQPTSASAASAHLACGDKTGKLRIYTTTAATATGSASIPLEMIWCIQAHSAEILSVAYSPIFTRSTTPDGAWSIASSSSATTATSQGTVEEMALLASAGRDRLIHVFACYSSREGYYYTPIDTLDHHTSSVTSILFTNDGRYLLSVGGDKSIVLYTLTTNNNTNNNNPTSSKHTTPTRKSSTRTNAAPITIQVARVLPITTGGNIHGIAIDLRNKFLVTSGGKDKKLHIYSLHTLKHVRGYKINSATTPSGLGGTGQQLDGTISATTASSELYQIDLDPSGSYIAVCAFDKTITIVDFYSGEIIYQIPSIMTATHAPCGHHSDLITNIKWTPDGQHLITASGDGCLFVWSVASYLVMSMQERLVEVYGNLWKRQQKIQSEIEKQQYHYQKGSAVLPPPPPPLAGGGTGAGVGVHPPLPPSGEEVNSSLASLKNKIASTNNQADYPPLTANSTTTISSMNTSGEMKRSRGWKTPSNLATGGATGAVSGAGGGEGDMISVDSSSEYLARKLPFRPSSMQQSALGTADGREKPLNKFTIQLESTNILLQDEKTMVMTKPPSMNNHSPRKVSEAVTEEDIYTKINSDPYAAELRADEADEGEEEQQQQGQHQAQQQQQPRRMLSSSMAATIMENEHDHVNLLDDSDEEDIEGEDMDDQEHLAADDDEQGEEDGDNLNATQEKLSHLQEKLEDINDWLESKLKSDAALDKSSGLPPPPPSFITPQKKQPAATAAVMAQPSLKVLGHHVSALDPNLQSPDLNQSLSSAFFQQLSMNSNNNYYNKLSSQAPVSETLPLPLPPVVSSTTTTTAAVVDEQVQQRKEEERLRMSSIKMSAMQERMRAMGVSMEQIPSTNKNQPTAEENNTTTTTIPTMMVSSSPDRRTTPSHQLLGESEDEELHSGAERSAVAVVPPRTMSTSISYGDLQKKAEKCKQVLRELEIAKERAYASYQELLSVQSSLLLTSSITTITNNSGSNDKGNAKGNEQDGVKQNQTAVMMDMTGEVMEMEQLLAQFRQSLTNFPKLLPASFSEAHNTKDAEHNSNNESSVLMGTNMAATSSSTSISNGTKNNDDLAAILEKYSDRLLDMVGEKIVSKISQK